MDAPERIWAATPADGKMKPETMYGWTTSEHLAEWKLDNDAEIELGCDDPLAYVEYIRADLCAYPALLAEAVEVLEYADRMVRLDLIHMTDFHHEDFSQAVVDTGRRIAAFLSKLENRHDDN